jgi:riboflavin synthase
VDGVSLTVNRVDGQEFEVNLIPHTLDVTTLSRLEPGAKVNVEIDLVARYLERMLHGDGNGSPRGTDGGRRLGQSRRGRGGKRRAA